MGRYPINELAPVVLCLLLRARYVKTRLKYAHRLEIEIGVEETRAARVTRLFSSSHIIDLGCCCCCCHRLGANALVYS